MDTFDPARDEDSAYLAAALVGFAPGIRIEDILATERGAPAHARARHIAMYLAAARRLAQRGRRWRRALAVGLGRVLRALKAPHIPCVV